MRAFSWKISLGQKSLRTLQTHFGKWGTPRGGGKHGWGQPPSRGLLGPVEGYWSTEGSACERARKILEGKYWTHWGQCWRGRTEGSAGGSRGLLQGRRWLRHASRFGWKKFGSALLGIFGDGSLGGAYGSALFGRQRSCRSKKPIPRFLEDMKRLIWVIEWAIRLGERFVMEWATCEEDRDEMKCLMRDEMKCLRKDEPRCLDEWYIRLEERFEMEWAILR